MTQEVKTVEAILSTTIDEYDRKEIIEDIIEAIEARHGEDVAINFESSMLNDFDDKEAELKVEIEFDEETGEVFGFRVVGEL